MRCVGIYIGTRKIERWRYPRYKTVAFPLSFFWISSRHSTACIRRLLHSFKMKFSALTLAVLVAAFSDVASAHCIPLSAWYQDEDCMLTLMTSRPFCLADCRRNQGCWIWKHPSEHQLQLSSYRYYLDWYPLQCWRHWVCNHHQDSRCWIKCMSTTFPLLSRSLLMSLFPGNFWPWCSSLPPGTHPLVSWKGPLRPDCRHLGRFRCKLDQDQAGRPHLQQWFCYMAHVPYVPLNLNHIRFHNS